ncbi:allene oxide cyclase barrel-like domain-containing protein [Streptomyces sp. NPDC055025]
MFENLSEHLVKFGSDIDFEDPKIGQSGTYVSELRDPSGTPIGMVEGFYKIVTRRDTDDELMTCITEKIALKDGDVHVEAWARFSNLVSGEWLYCPAVGVSGQYAGRTGFRQWRPVDPGKVADAKIVFFSTLLS